MSRKVTASKGKQSGAEVAVSGWRAASIERRKGYQGEDRRQAVVEDYRAVQKGLKDL